MLLAGVVATVRTGIASAGALAIAEAGDTLAATGILRITGALAVTEAGDTLLATAVPPNTADVTVTETDDTLTAAGQEVPPITAIFDVVEAADTLVATGEQLEPITGVASIVEAGDTLVAEGVEVGPVVGVLAVTEASDTLAATGANAPPIEGVLSVTEADDTLVGTGAIATYPFPLTITNPGAEAGSATGWTEFAAASYPSVPTAESSGTSGITSHAGSFHFLAAASSARTWWHQKITLPSDVLADVDLGHLEVTGSVWHIGLGADTDSGALAVNCYDSGGTNWLAGKFLEQSDPASWTQETITFRVPPTTREIWIAARSVRVTGTQLSAYFDDFELSLDVAADDHVLLYSQSQANTTGWTNVTGTLGAFSPSVGWTAETVFRWASDAAGEAYRSISITDAGQQAAIDAGACSVQALCVHSSFTDNDTGRFYLECRDGGGSLLGSRTYSDGAEVDAPVDGRPVDFSMAVPTSTRSIRFGLVGTRNTGTELSSYANRIAVFLTGL